MRTKYCPHCGSENIHREEEECGSHYHECDECQETWTHCDSVKIKMGLPSWHSKPDDEVDPESDEFDKKIALRGNN